MGSGRLKKYWSCGLPTVITVDQGGLAAGRPPAPLRVVGRVGRDVAHVDHVELGDINPQPMVGEQKRTESPRGNALPALPCQNRPPERCAPGLDADDGAGRVLVETEKELIGATATRGRTRHADEVVVGVTPSPALQIMVAAGTWYPETSPPFLQLTGSTRPARRRTSSSCRMTISASATDRPLRVVRPWPGAGETDRSLPSPRGRGALWSHCAERSVGTPDEKSRASRVVDGPARRGADCFVASGFPATRPAGSPL